MIVNQPHRSFAENQRSLYDYLRAYSIGTLRVNSLASYQCEIGFKAQQTGPFAIDHEVSAPV